MKIVCRLQRNGGSVITLGKEKYHFKPESEDGHHVCEVKNKDHVETLLGIPEGYHRYGEEPVDPVPEIVVPETKDIEKMTNNDLNDWAKQRGINPRSKQSIVDYVQNEYDITLDFDDSVNCAGLLREAAKIAEEVDEDEAGEEAGS